MRIQHNIMAMNSYRNLSGNNSALSKNLEKLSSGYRINRAGDDAAGLAISEKMRAQIAGLDQAQKNAQSGINLVKTAEGALTEVHDMLNRMTTLATQSANGTYTKTDREKLQAEVNALTAEIDRIADNSNFNGAKLLNGELNGAVVTTTTGVAGQAAVTAVTGVLEVTVSQHTATNADGDIEVTVGGKMFTVASNISSAASQAAEWATKFGASVGGYTVAATGTKITFTETTAGAGNQKNLGLTGLSTATTGVAGKAAVTGTGTTTDIDFSHLTGNQVIGGTLKIGDITYEFIDSADAKATAQTGNTAVKVAANATAAQIVTALKAELDKDISGVLSTNTLSVDGTGTKLTYTEDMPTGASIYDGTVDPGVTVEQKVMGGLDLQIGADAVETIGVNVASMKAQDLGISNLDITSVEAANKAIDTIKAAIEKVSVQRGDLGAIQNRLEHTINNLGVMEENIQDAEANIRDTDIADEMMAYTKNNILIQSAQAMLAQANQVPQGVLQLMQ